MAPPAARRSQPTKINPPSTGPPLAGQRTRGQQPGPSAPLWTGRAGPSTSGRRPQAPCRGTRVHHLQQQRLAIPPPLLPPRRQAPLAFKPGRHPRGCRKAPPGRAVIRHCWESVATGAARAGRGGSRSSSSRAEVTPRSRTTPERVLLGLESLVRLQSESRVRVPAVDIEIFPQHVRQRALSAGCGLGALVSDDPASTPGGPSQCYLCRVL